MRLSKSGGQETACGMWPGAQLASAALDAPAHGWVTAVLLDATVSHNNGHPCPSKVLGHLLLLVLGIWYFVGHSQAEKALTCIGSS